MDNVKKFRFAGELFQKKVKEQPSSFIFQFATDRQTVSKEVIFMNKQSNFPQGVMLWAGKMISTVGGRPISKSVRTLEGRKKC